MTAVQRAALRMLRLLPVAPPPPGTVAAADLATSLADARAALTLAAGGTPDVDGYDRTPAQLPLWGIR